MILQLEAHKPYDIATSVRNEVAVDSGFRAFISRKYGAMTDKELGTLR
jgi:hypothetical protein